MTLLARGLPVLFDTYELELFFESVNYCPQAHAVHCNAVHFHSSCDITNIAIAIDFLQGSSQILLQRQRRLILRI